MTQKQQARLIDPARDPYDLLLEDYEKGMTGARLDEIFAEVSTGLLSLMAMTDYEAEMHPE